MLAALALLPFVIIPLHRCSHSEKPQEEILTVNMKASVLISALEERASDWCEVSRTIPVMGDVVISSRDGETALRLYDIMMLTDSMASKMAEEFPHLFRYEEKSGVKRFQMSANRTSVTVPVWLVKNLIDREVLLLPDVETQDSVPQ